MGGRVRFRIDGRLCELETLDGIIFAPLVSRIKLLAGMDISDRRQPQDGRYTITSQQRTFEARVSSVPTVDGEKVVLRLLDMRARGAGLDALGMSPGVSYRYRQLLRSPYGFIIVTGPTGSGKTTTVYSSLREIDDESRSICTVEDPVEVLLPGVSQVNVNVRAGLDFATVLRSLLRQDPNVIMIGEMRDGETAAVAIRAALSGQLVFTTLHSNDAPRAIERLVDLGVDRRAIAASILGILAQRLIRRLCGACRRSLNGDTESTSASAGCEKCAHSGYFGRTGIFELLEIDDEAREAIAAGASIVTVAAAGKRLGYEPLIVDGMSRVAAGDTSQDELRRVVALPS